MLYLKEKILVIVLKVRTLGRLGDLWLVRLIVSFDDTHLKLNSVILSEAIDQKYTISFYVSA